MSWLQNFDATKPKASIFDAAMKNKIETITRLVKSCVNFKIQNGNDKTPLFFAAMNNKAEMFTNQAKLGANIEANTTKAVFLCRRYS